ncbi:MAG: hypothetical protein QM781_06085 [Chitinophagaceae bacterium]
MNPHSTIFRKMLLSILLMVLFSFYMIAAAQEKDKFVRIARIVVDSAQLKAYNTALK